MRLISLRLENFKSFRKLTTFTFPEGAGLFFLRGENREELRLDANGAGKSTIWDALTWLFYEKTVRGLRAGDVCSWGVKGGARVELDFEAEGIYYTLTRTWRPNSWKLWSHYEGITDSDWKPDTDLVKDPDNPVLADLRLTYDVWLNCVVIAAAEPMFLDLKAEAKAQLFSSILNLDRWLDLSAKASKRAAEQDRVTRGLESDLARLEGQLKQLEDRGDADRAAEWEKRYKELKQDLIERYEEADVREHHANVVQREQERILQDMNADYKRMQEVQRDAQEKLALARAELKQASVILNDTCPTCGQEIHATDEMRAVLKEAKAKENEVIRALDAHHRGMDDLLGQIHRQESKVSDARLEHSQAERVIDRLADEADRLQKDTNPYSEAAERQADQRRQVERQRSRALDELEDSESLQRRYAYWVTGFKEIRLAQIAEGLQELEIEVNSRCVELGLVGWALRFSVDKETKKGTVTRGFSVMVESPSNEGPVPWEAWSGGETQRLRQAGQMGLADLARSRLGVPREVPEIWDEPTQGLSAQGVTDLLDCLAARAIAEGRQIWVVDHHSLGYGSFDGVTTIYKTGEGSFVEGLASGDEPGLKWLPQ